ncbi:MAG TPA: prepilin-type N-terminal cleavage/methylation domain-containing protein [Deltaproteobacteria bacterium]|nr:prepilin-type N-terminal cleavage/methylation domain-containing protein [Deltaproteobacteria bacterium]
MAWNKEQRGFTLVEIAVILVVIGILVSMGAGMMAMLTKRAKRNETKAMVDSAVEAVVGFGASSGRLPTTAEFPGLVSSVRDAWAKTLLYVPDTNMTATATGGICGRKTTSLTVRTCPDAACASPSSTVSDVALLVISGGGNYNIQTSGSSTINVYDYGVTGVDDYTSDMNRAEEYDDIVRWLTLNEVRIKAGCTGAQLRVVNTELPAGTVSSTYSASIYADGGVPFTAGGSYRWCIENASGTLPAWISRTPASTPVSTNCQGVAETLWGQGNTLTLSGTPTAAGTTSIIVFTRDNNDTGGANDNIARRAFVLTIS